MSGDNFLKAFAALEALAALPASAKELQLELIKQFMAEAMKIGNKEGLLLLAERLEALKPKVSPEIAVLVEKAAEMLKLLAKAL
uniref:D3-threaded n=1 Tax=synthetic construct TaxID=32630 RepID=UPI003B642B92